MFIKKAIFLVAVYACAVSAVPVAQSVDFSEGLAPLVESLNAEIIADSYIVVLKKDLPEEDLNSHRKWINSIYDNAILKDIVDPDIGSGIKHTYNSRNLKGYSGKFSPRVIEKIRASEQVAYVERDSIVYASELQTGAPWGLSRISNRDALTLRTYSKYRYDPRAGENVTVYVIDTGVNIKHVDFGGRAEWGKTIPEGDVDEDGNGHGSHVAGTIAGKKYGVAKKARIVAVKVLRSNGSGTMSDVVAGVDWAISAHEDEVALAIAQGRKPRPSVANMSLGGGKHQSLDDIVNDAVDAGIVFAVAAGNDNRNACDYSPAAAEKAITVGATTIEDERAYFSNYGECVDIFAPGMNIQSVWIGSRTATNTISGTSMASPHVAGLAAYYLSLIDDDEDIEITPKYIKNLMIELSSKDKLEKIPKNTVNRIIYNDPPSDFYNIYQ